MTEADSATETILRRLDAIDAKLDVHLTRTSRVLGRALLGAVTDLQDELSRQDLKAHTVNGEVGRSPFVHAEALKGLIMELFGLEDVR